MIHQQVAIVNHGYSPLTTINFRAPSTAEIEHQQPATALGVADDIFFKKSRFMDKDLEAQLQNKEWCA